MTARRAAGAFLLLGVAALGGALTSVPARADKIRNPTAFFPGLD